MLRIEKEKNFFGSKKYLTSKEGFATSFLGTDIVKILAVTETLFLIVRLIKINKIALKYIIAGFDYNFFLCLIKCYS